MKFENNLPIYVQIVDYIKKQIVKRELKEGDKLPSVREIATNLKVNPNTVQRSYQELEREDLVYTQRGMGTFVTEDTEKIYELKRNMAFSMVNDFVENMKEIGFSLEEMIDLIKLSSEEGR